MMMNVTKKINNKINQIPRGETFNYKQLLITKKEYLATAKALERLIKKGIIKRISTGIFYRPKETIFGELKPSEDKLIKPYLFKNNKRIAYITGAVLYNKMRLTTQIPKNIKIATRDKRVNTFIGDIKITSVRSYVDVTDKNYHYLEILDILKDFNKIPDLNKESGVNILINKINSLSKQEINQLIEIGLNYPPRTRAFLGAFLEKLNITVNINLLEESLNPLSEYKLNINNNILSTARNWNIKYYNLNPFQVLVLSPKRTLCEKIMSLVRFSFTETPIVDLRNKIRHIYDIHMILKDYNLNFFFNSSEFDEIFLKVANDDVSSFKNNNKWLSNHPKTSILFSDTQNTWSKIRNTYLTSFKELVFGDLPSEVEIINTLMIVAERLEGVDWNIKLLNGEEFGSSE